MGDPGRGEVRRRTARWVRGDGRRGENGGWGGVGWGGWEGSFVRLLVG